MNDAQIKKLLKKFEPPPLAEPCIENLLYDLCRIIDHGYSPANPLVRYCDYENKNCTNHGRYCDILRSYALHATIARQKQIRKIIEEISLD